MLLHEIIGIITVVMSIGIHVPYFLDTFRGKIRPHPFTWVLWTLLTIIIFIAQFIDGAGPGSWGTGVVAVFCVSITLASIRYGFQNIKPADVIMFVVGLLTIPLWILTEDPTLSVIIIVVIDLIAFAPTYRKSYHKPYDEPLYHSSLNFIRHGLTLFAIANFTLVTALFPFMVGIANGSLFLFLLWRRRALKIEGKV
jgi:hypothetical protein